MGKPDKRNDQHACRRVLYRCEQRNGRRFFWYNPENNGRGQQLGYSVKGRYDPFARGCFLH
jgi:hypothetical protein